MKSWNTGCFIKTMKINVFTEGGITLPYNGITKRKVGALAKKICGRLGLDDVAVCVILTDNEHIRAINRDYRKKNRPTDVISFAYHENPFPEVDAAHKNLGDIYISLEKLHEQAMEYGVTDAQEFTRLLVHGVLHCAGYDHERSRDDEKIMREKEEELLSML